MQYHIKKLLKLVLMPFLSSVAFFGLTVKKQGDILKAWENLITSFNYREE